MHSMARATPRHNAAMTLRVPTDPRPARPARGSIGAALGWLAAVLLLHALALYWVSTQLPRWRGEPPPPVVYARILLPQPAPPVAPSQHPARPHPARPRQRSAPTLMTQRASSHASRRSPAAARAAGPRQPPHTPASAPKHAHAPRSSPASTPASIPASTPAAAPASTAGSAAGPAAGTKPAAPPPPAHPGSAPAAAPAPAWPPSTRLDFALSGYYRGALHGNGRLEWRRHGSHYMLRLQGSALIDFSYTSIGQIHGAWLAPDRYVEQVLFHSKTVDFDRAARQLHFSAISTSMPLPRHLEDSASVFMQLAHELRTHAAEFSAGHTLRLRVARPSGTTIWSFRIAGRQRVRTGVGRLDCWHLEYDPPQSSDMGAQVWLAPALQNLPVQIRLRRGANEYLLFTLRRAMQ